MITLKVYQADEGDSFLLSFGNKTDHILIDLGTARSYRENIELDLCKLGQNNNKISLLIITHTDNDHIAGAIPFLQANGMDRNIIQVNEIWHNSYKQLQFCRSKNNVTKLDEKNILKGMIQVNSVSNGDGISDVGIKEGVSFASLIVKYQYPWNTFFNSQAVSIDNGRIYEKDGVKLILLSPNNHKLDKLAGKWLSALEEKIFKFQISEDEIFDDAFEFYFKHETTIDTIVSDCSISSLSIDRMCAIEEQDTSATNGSSMSFIVEYEGVKILFLGDAHEDIIYDELFKLQDSGYSLNFNLIKISHHGSNKNISRRLLNLIDTSKYLISTNGKKHGHPSKETIAKIINKKTEYHKEIIFNYKIEHIKSYFEPLQERYDFSMIYSNRLQINN